MNISADGFTVAKCIQCGSLYFPHRLICHRCGGHAWTDEHLRNAVIEETTTLSPVAGDGDRGLRYLATVHAAEGLRLVAGLDEPLPEGTCVILMEKDGAPVVRRTDPK